MAQLEVRRGDTRVWRLQFLDTLENPVSLSGATVWWTVRPAIPANPGDDPADAEAIIRGWWEHNGASVVSSGVVGPDGQAGGLFDAPAIAGGQMQITLYPRLTTQLPTAPPGGTGIWRYDVQVLRSPEEVHTWDDGTLKVTPDVTRRTVAP